MGIEYTEIMTKAFNFSYRPRRWLPLYIADLVFLAIFLVLFLSNSEALIAFAELSMESQPDFAATAAMINSVLYALSLGAVWMIVRIWIAGAIVHQSHKPKEFDKSWRVSGNRIFTLVITSFLVSLIGMIGGAIPTVGWVVSLVLTWVFFFIIQAIIVDNLNVIESMKKSYHIFRNKAFDVFVIWILIALVSISIVVIFSMPMIASFVGSFMTMAMAEASSAEALSLFFLAVQENLGVMVVTGMIALVGMEISTVLGLKAQTDFYMKAGKKGWGK